MQFTIENYLEGSSYGKVSLTEIITLAVDQQSTYYHVSRAYRLVKMLWESCINACLLC